MRNEGEPEEDEEHEADADVLDHVLAGEGDGEGQSLERDDHPRDILHHFGAVDDAAWAKGQVHGEQVHEDEGDNAHAVECGAPVRGDELVDDEDQQQTHQYEELTVQYHFLAAGFVHHAGADYSPENLDH